MITRADIVERVTEWGLTEEVVEKDYVLGWLLWGIGTDPVLSESWVFKGGTCLKKCYIETYRFSEDLDFTVLPGGPFRPEDVEPLLLQTLARTTAESGIDFSTPPRLRLRPNETSTEGRVYYTGPRRTPAPARVKLDISADETVVRPPVLRPIAHPYPDAFPGGRTVRCYSFDELFAEKIRAMAQRGRPRDLYDIVNLFRRNDLRMFPDAIRSALVEKCAAKSIAVPTAADFAESPLLAELKSEWATCSATSSRPCRHSDRFSMSFRCCLRGSTAKSMRSLRASSRTHPTKTSRGRHRRALPPGAPASLSRRCASPQRTISLSSWTTTAVHA